MKSISIKAEPFSQMLVISSEDKNEVCAMMLGNNNLIDEMITIPNEKPSPVYFEFSSKQSAKVHEYAMKNNKKVLGIFHSHPGNHPNPSGTDYDWMSENPYVWTIYSPLYKTWASWMRIGNEIKPVVTEIVY